MRDLDHRHSGLARGCGEVLSRPALLGLGVGVFFGMLVVYKTGAIRVNSERTIRTDHQVGAGDVPGDVLGRLPDIDQVRRAVLADGIDQRAWVVKPGQGNLEFGPSPAASRHPLPEGEG